MLAPERPARPRAAREPHATIDFETRSAKMLGSKTGVGPYRYSRDPSTQILCLAWSYGDPDQVFLWHPAFPNADLPERGREDLERLFEWIRAGKLVEAHNVFFERCVWNNIGAARHGWPALDPKQLRCSAAKAAAYGLPRKLDGALEALRALVRKDKAGHKVMQKVHRPRKPRKAEWTRSGCTSAEHYTQRFGLLWSEKPEDLQRVFDYNRQDVRAEMELSRLCPELRPEELRAWQMDQDINWAGIRIDEPGVRRAQEIVVHEQARLDAELAELTFGEVTRCTQRDALHGWCQRESGNMVPNLQAPMLDLLLKERQLPEHVLTALALRREASRTSLGKYAKMLAFVCDGERVRDILTFCGAAHTGRWSGAGIQPQNFPRGSLNKCKECGYALIRDERCPLDPDAKTFSFPQPELWHDINTLTIPQLVAKYRDLLNMLSHALRGAIIASKGCLLYVADFAQIEARVLFWIAGEARALQILTSGQSIYKDMAGAIYGIPDPQKNVQKGTPQYQIGKNSVLGLGYQMGWRKFIAECLKVGIEITEEFADQVVGLYRSTYTEVPALWRAAEAAAIQAVRSPGIPVRCKNLTYKRAGRSLLCRLPSGRTLTYMYPQISMEPVPWSETELRPKLRYWAVDGKTKRWTRQGTYGGKLIENAVQAISRDLMRDAMFRAAERGYTPVLTVHDEVVTDDPDGFGDVKELEHIMAELPVWAKGAPIEAEGFASFRYQK